MFFLVPVSYNVNVVYPRCTKVENLLCGEWVEVHLAEVEPHDAPIAMRWAPTLPFDAPNGMHETRWYDGSHWDPVCYSASREVPVPVTDETLERYCADGTSYANPLVDGNSTRDIASGRLKPLAETPIRRLAWSGRDEAIEEAHGRAANLILVDGAVWRRSSEPVYTYSDTHHGIFVSVKRVNAVTGDSERAFAADRWDDMLDHASDGVADVRASIRDTRRITVLVPDSVRHDDETPALFSSIKGFISWAESSLAGMPVDGLVAWARMRDAFAAASAKDAAPEAVAAAVAAVEEHRRVNHADDGSWYSQEIDKALTRWNVRPVKTQEVTAGREGPRAA